MSEQPSGWRVRGAALCVAMALVLPEDIRAQDEVGLRVQQFEPDSSGLGYFTTESARTGTLGRVIFGLHFNYASGVLGTWNGDELQSWAVERQLGVDLAVGMGFDMVDVVVRIPFAPYQSGSGVAGAEFGVAAFGDVVVTPKVRILNPDSRPVGLAFALPVSFPSGNAGALYGEPGMTVTPTAVGEVRVGPLDAGVNLGVVARKKGTVQGLDVGAQFLYRLAVRVRPVPVFGLQAELWGVAGSNVAASPANWLGGLYVNTDKGLVVRAGVGTGIGAGYGAPKVRVVFGIGGCRPAPSDKDLDTDGVTNRRDECPEAAEDHDGFEDADGCPDPDNDGDGVLDEFDLCPVEWENENGFEDGDGCPDDLPGATPLMEEPPLEEPPLEDTVAAALPDLDTGYDSGGDWLIGGSDDDVDADADSGDWLTADLEEDIDWSGLEDADGDVDWDDGGDDLAVIPGQAPPAPGIPWDGGGLVEYDAEAGDIELTQPVVFLEGTANLSPDSFAVLNRVADLLLARPEIALIEIQGHTAEHDSTTSNRILSQHRGETVAKYLINRGVDQYRLIVVGYGDARASEIAGVQHIEFHVLQRGAAKE